MLPEGYFEKSSFVFDRRKLLIAVIVGVLLFIVSSIGFSRFFELLRPDVLQLDIIKVEDSIGLSLDFAFILSFLASAMVVHILHELVHGLFYRILTGTTPRLELKGLALMVSGLEGFLYRRGEYIIIGAAPLILLTLLGVVLGLFLPSSMLVAIFMSLVFNVAGSAGDVIILFWLLRQSPESLIIERGSDIVILTR